MDRVTEDLDVRDGEEGRGASRTLINGSGSVRWRSFLRDVFICSLGAYGGPEAHMGVFLDQMVTKNRYLTEDELVELMALCSILPGPTSTQTLVSIGYKTGGPLLALLTILVWALPVLVAMTLLSFLYRGLDEYQVSRTPHFLLCFALLGHIPARLAPP